MLYDKSHSGYSLPGVPAPACYLLDLEQDSFIPAYGIRHDGEVSTSVSSEVRPDSIFSAAFCANGRYFVYLQSVGQGRTSITSDRLEDQSESLKAPLLDGLCRRDFSFPFFLEERVSEDTEEPR